MAGVQSNIVRFGLVKRGVTVQQVVAAGAAEGFFWAMTASQSVFMIIWGQT